MKRNILILILTIFLAVLLSGAVSATKISDLSANNKFSDDYQNNGQVYTQNSDTSLTTQSQSSQNIPDPVNLRTQKSYSTIQDAIDDPATRNGDIILVEPGTYTENVIVHKSLGIISSGTATVQAANPNLPVFTITAPFTVISNFTITGSTNSYGILIQSSLNVIKNNQITFNGHGIGMIPSSSIHQVVFGNTIYKNRIIGNYGDGVNIESSPLNYIANNEIKSNTNYGLHLQSSSYNKITKNDLTLNGLGDRLITGESYKNTFSGNNPLP